MMLGLVAAVGIGMNDGITLIDGATATFRVISSASSSIFILRSGGLSVGVGVFGMLLLLLLLSMLLLLLMVPMDAFGLELLLFVAVSF